MSKPTMLFVNDDDMTRTNAARIYGGFGGFDVTLAENRNDALEKLKQRPFDIMITDLEMEHKTAGIELTLATRALYPNMPILLDTNTRGAELIRAKEEFLKAGGTGIMDWTAGIDSQIAQAKQCLSTNKSAMTI